MVVENKVNKPVDKIPSTLTIASVDNVNKRSSYAAVKSTDVHRGFDGTSVQLVEPKPQSISLNPDERLAVLPVNYLDMTALVYVTGSAVNIFEEHNSIKPIVQLRANPDSNHSINLLNKNGLYFPLISRQDYFDGVLFQESIDIKDTITMRSINNFNQKLSSIVDIYSSLNSGQTSVKYRRRTTKLPHYAIHNSKICTDLVDDMITDSAACLSKNVEKVSFDLIDFESTVSEKGAADSVNAGLKELIELFQHGAVGASVMQATNFDKTHHFLMQVWEAFYLQQISTILKYAEENDLNDQSEENYIKRYENGQLKHAFNSKVVLTDIQRSDLLNLQKIAQEHLGKYIKICQSDGIFRYNKTRKIATFSTKTHSISKVKRELKDQRTENYLLRKQIAWSKEQNTPISDLDNKKQLVQLVSEKNFAFCKIALNSGQSFVIGGGFENASITKVVKKILKRLPQTWRQIFLKETEENTAETVASTQVLYNSESDASDFRDDTMDGSVFFELQNVDDDDLENIIFNFQYQHLA
ncbi:unnamed protein product [Mytilus coruscus]|uniref:Uncharacterized protein n=1 Tax=Mytilus coruscus TaxID=42192 RepID=A0A6J8C0Z9_MYTCO|nr:unnamed protein product [Mytilus coruscus]